MRNHRPACHVRLFATAFVPAPTFAQDGTTAIAPATASSGDDPVELSPFVVSFAGKRRTLNVQLNVQNLLGEEDLIPYSSAVPGVVLRYMYPSVRRSWTLKAAYRF
jgi:hypothetical protein